MGFGSVACLVGAFSIHRNEDIGDMIVVRVRHLRVGCSMDGYGRYGDEEISAVEPSAILCCGRSGQRRQIFGTLDRGPGSYRQKSVMHRKQALAAKILRYRCCCDAGGLDVSTVIKDKSCSHDPLR
jgi:hypothetical protein